MDPAVGICGTEKNQGISKAGRRRTREWGSYSPEMVARPPAWLGWRVLAKGLQRWGLSWDWICWLRASVPMGAAVFCFTRVGDKKARRDAVRLEGTHVKDWRGRTNRLWLLTPIFSDLEIRESSFPFPFVPLGPASATPTNLVSVPFSLSSLSPS